MANYNIFLLCFMSHCNLINMLSTAFYCVTPVTLLQSLKSIAPGGDLIRVDLIRFPGSIPGDKKLCTN